MRKRIYEIIEASDGNDVASSLYDAFMMLVIILSLLPLNFKEETAFFLVTDKITAFIFIIDYILRWSTADFGSSKRRAVAYIEYPFSAMAIIDLLSILPSLSILNRGFKMLRILRMFRAMRVLRVFKFVRYSKNLQIMVGQGTVLCPIRRLSGCRSVSSFQQLALQQRNEIISRLLDAGLSVRQISRLTGVSKSGVARCSK